MSKTVDLPIPQTAAERIAAQGAPVRPVSPQWLEGLCAHVDEDGLIGEPAAKSLLQEVLQLRAVLEELDGHFDDEVDVVDGDDGQPRPNEAMQWQQRIREALGRERR